MLPPAASKYLILALMILGSLSRAQTADLNLGKEKRLLTIEARIGYYWGLASIPDSTQNTLTEFYEDMGKGPRTDISVLYALTNYLDIGFNYSFFSASASTERLGITYITNSGLQRQLYGRLNGDIRQQYFAIRIDPHFDLGRFFAINAGVSSGIVTYTNRTSIGELRQEISGSTMSFEIHVGLEYFLDQHFSINLMPAYNLGFLHEPDIQNSLEEISAEDSSVGLSNWSIGIGVRYTFTKKGSALPGPDQNHPAHRKGRFN